MFILSFQTFFFFFAFYYALSFSCCWKLDRKYLVKGTWTGSHKGLCSWVSVLVSCFSLCLPIYSHLPYDLRSLMDTRKVTDFPSVQLYYYMHEHDDSQVSYTPDQKLEVWFHCFCVLPSFLLFPPHTFFHLSSPPSSYGGPPPPFSFGKTLPKWPQGE